MQKDPSYNLPFELLGVALGFQDGLSREYSAEEWDACYQFARKQSILGVLFHGIELLRNHGNPEKQRIVNLQKRQFMRWVWRVDKIRERSKRLDEGCQWVTRWLGKAGFHCVILKGQSLKNLYEPDLLRTPGDVDVWVLDEKHNVCRFLQENVPGYDPREEGDLHTSFEKRGVTFEVHFTATYLISPKYEQRLKIWIESQKDILLNSLKDIDCRQSTVKSASGNITLSAPSLEFNLVYLMLHMYRHYLFEGIGLRHVVDYILALRASEDSKVFHGFSSKTYETLKWLGVEDFANAMMWVMNEITGEKSNADSWRGRMLMNAILEGGNFGKSDKRNSDEYRRWGLKRLWRFVSRNSILVVAYPSEILWHLAKRTGLKKS